LHASADGITRGQDIVGSDNILAWLQSYPNQYDYKSHEVIAGAVDEQNNSAFSFFLDQVGLFCELPPYHWRHSSCVQFSIPETLQETLALCVDLLWVLTMITSPL
jgi:hypothetical protein